MSRVTQVLGRVGFGAMVVGAMGFGATQALAGFQRTDDCQPCPYPSQSECIECCQGLDFEDGYCAPSGSCLCI